MTDTAPVGEDYTFDAAKVGPCPQCGTPVRMFSGAQWWIDGRSPPPFKGWWCPDCLKEKCRRALEGVRA